jgi:hypothetical protein
MLAVAVAAALAAPVARAGMPDPPFAYVEGGVIDPQPTVGGAETSLGPPISLGGQQMHPTFPSVVGQFQCDASAFGALSARAQGDAPVIDDGGVPRTGQVRAYAEAWFGDVLTFSGGPEPSFVVRIDFLLSGDLSVSHSPNPFGPPGGVARVEVTARVLPDGGPPHQFSDSIAIGVLGVPDPKITHRVVSSTISMEARVSNGVPLPISGELTVAANAQAAAASSNFLSTLEPVVVVAPKGVTWTSASGLFFGSSTPTSTTSTTVGTGSSSTTTTTSTTLPGEACAGIPAGATFASVACRLALLRDAVSAEPALGKLQKKLLKKVEMAHGRVGEAGDACAAGSRKAAKRLKQAVKGLEAFGRKLASKKAEKQLTPEVRAHFTTAAAPILADAQTLRDGVTCPDDAPAA